MTETEPPRGIRGEQGQTGREGRPGQTGQEGKPGQTGQTGKEGAAGTPGDRGENGARGRVGPATPTLKLTDRRLIFMFVSGLIIFGLIAWRGEINATAIQNTEHRVDTLNYTRCVLRNDNVAKANAFYRAMAALEAKNRFIDAQFRDERVKLYSSLIYTPADCGTRP